MSTERLRLQEILTAPEAKDRKALAEHLAFATDMTAADARALLAIAPVDRSTATRWSFAGLNTSQSITGADEHEAAEWSAIADQLNREMKAAKPGYVVPLLTH
ncbi:hypothetical protein RZS28_04020 [Methylocapsa polymorpha]|uniref:Uncharacterized protein n=1 Tax=Methylocapsa polymorpha TaxID=3080828 RepID=A0ABZ0HT42_9HYPH|nr:hypothetical protein RZS28_04020 [Methylocapsa sp. RX1]